MRLGIPELIVVVFLLVYFLWVPGAIMKKTGRSRALGLLWLLPVVNMGVLIWLAYSEWPIEAEAKRLRESVQILQGLKTHAHV